MTTAVPSSGPASFSADVPIQNREQDLLGYWPFAQSIARGITERSPNEGFVLGLQARWGLGKTSAVNLIIRAIEVAEEGLEPNQRTIVAYFNPWLFAGLENLASGYLTQLGQLLARSLGKKGSGATREFVKKMVAGGQDFLGSAASAGVVLATGGAAAPFAGAVNSTVKKAAARAGETKKSVEEQLRDVSSTLGKLSQRILLVVDDLDRLTPPELRQILTLLKTFGGLPRITHLLVYDRNIVDAALLKEFGETAPGKAGRNPTFREKIVQVEFDLPPPTRSGLQNLIEERLQAALAGDAVEADKFWFQVWRVAYQNYLLTPRDIVRFMNALSVTWPAVRGEVYPPDLIAMELLRHFERSTYDAIRANGDYLTGVGHVFGDDARKKEAIAILETIDPSRSTTVGNLVAALFPTIAKHHSIYEDDGPARPLSGRRVRDPEGFPAFFGFSAPEAAIPMDEKRGLAASLHEGAKLSEAFKAALAVRRADGTSNVGLLVDAIQEIINEKEEKFSELMVVTLQFADQIIDRIDETEGYWFTVDNRERLRNLIRSIYVKWPAENLDELRAIVLDPSTSLGSAALLIGLLGSPHKLVFQSSLPIKADEMFVRELGRSFCSRINKAAAEGTLHDSPELWLVLKVWELFGPSSEAHAWVLEALQTPDEAAAIGMLLGGLVRSTAEPHRYYQFSQGNVTTALQPAEIVPVIEDLLGEGRIAQDKREALEQIIVGARRWLASPAETEDEAAE